MWPHGVVISNVRWPILTTPMQKVRTPRTPSHAHMETTGALRNSASVSAGCFTTAWYTQYKIHPVAAAISRRPRVVSKSIGLVQAACHRRLLVRKQSIYECASRYIRSSMRLLRCLIRGVAVPSIRWTDRAIWSGLRYPKGRCVRRAGAPRRTGDDVIPLVEILLPISHGKPPILEQQPYFIHEQTLLTMYSPGLPGAGRRYLILSCDLFIECIIVPFPMLSE